MGLRIRIISGDVHAEAELNDSSCAQALAAALPLEAKASRWGDEIYFRTPVNCASGEDARDTMDVGELAYWPPGKALCILFGPTPASEADGRPRMASDSYPVGRVVGDAAVFRGVREGDPIRVEAAP